MINIKEIVSKYLQEEKPSKKEDMSVSDLLRYHKEYVEYRASIKKPVNPDKYSIIVTFIYTGNISTIEDIIKRYEK